MRNGAPELTMPFDPQPMEGDPIVAAYCARRERGLKALFQVLEGRIDQALLREARATLELFHGLPDSGRLEVLLAPSFHQWWFGISNALKARDSRRLAATLCELGRLLVIPALRCHGGLPMPVRVPTGDYGEVRMPGSSVHILASFPANRMVLLVQESDYVVLRSDGAIDVAVPWRQLLGQDPRHERLVARARIDATRIEVDSTDPWIRTFLDHIQRHDPAPDQAVGDTEPVSPTAAYIRRLTDALQDLASAWPEMHREVLDHVRLIVPFHSAHKWSFTNTAMLGAMYLHHEIDDMSFLVETIVHETSHLRLNMYMELERIHEHAESDRLSSPFRAGPRPVSGLYHGVFVFTRIAEAMLRLHRISGHPKCAERVEATLRQAQEGIAEIHDHVRLAPAGQALLDLIQQRIETLAARHAS